MASASVIPIQKSWVRLGNGARCFGVSKLDIQQVNGTRCYQTNSEFGSGLNIVRPSTFLPPARQLIAVIEHGIALRPEILNLLNKLISSGDQRKIRIAATYLQWVYLFYPHDRPDLNLTRRYLKLEVLWIRQKTSPTTLRSILSFLYKSKHFRL